MNIDPDSQRPIEDVSPQPRSLEEFERLAREADRRLRPVVYRIVGEDVDDVLQVAYLRAFRAWPQFDGRAATATWMYAIAVNVALDHLRARKRSAIALARTGGPVVSGGDIAGDVSESVDLARALHRLPVDQRVALLLVDGQGLTHTEAASALRVPVGTIGSRLSRARASMRLALQGGAT